jgi:hypothetical protein
MVGGGSSHHYKEKTCALHNDRSHQHLGVIFDRRLHIERTVAKALATYKNLFSLKK